MAVTSKQMLTVLAIALALVSSTYAQGQGKNPCHANKAALGAGVTCEGVTLPPNICSKCALKEPAQNGNFMNCKSIYNINTAQCKAELQSYVNMNPCDGKRKQQVQRFNGADIEGLDYFLYSLCENCCDCIKQGAKSHMFGSLSSGHSWGNPKLWTTNRGNCPAHAFYDVCKVLPNIRYVTFPGGPKDNSWPKACPLLTQWFHSPASNDWINNQNAYSKPEVKRFLNLLNTAASCNKNDVWQKCLTLEQRQQRV